MIKTDDEEFKIGGCEVIS